MFEGFGVRFLCETNSDRGGIPGQQLNLLPSVEGHQLHVVFQQDGTPPYWAFIVREILDMHFPGAGLGVISVVSAIACSQGTSQIAREVNNPPPFTLKKCKHVSSVIPAWLS